MTDTDLHAALERLQRRLKGLRKREPWPQFGLIGDGEIARRDARTAYNACLDHIEDEVTAILAAPEEDRLDRRWTCPECGQEYEPIPHVHLERSHTQECIDAFYDDGGQSGCICGAESELSREPGEEG